MNKKFAPGSVMPEPQPSGLAIPPPCKHLRLVPLEYRYAKVVYPDGYAKEPYYDYATTLMAANICRVKTYLCLDCMTEIEAPKRKE